MGEPHRATRSLEEKGSCPKCGGAGWVWADELDEAPDPWIIGDMTKYTCDHDSHYQASEGCGS